MNSPSLFVFQLIALLFSVMVHEIAHGAIALKLGDETAKRAGRLTLNPIKHIDPFGSILLPAALFLLTGGGIVLGWAKPVPYNPLNLKNPKTGAGLIAAAGPVTNLTLAIVFGILARVFAGSEYISDPLNFLLNIVILTNVSLAIFNLLPLPPLDGSGILFSLLPNTARAFQEFMLRYGTFVLIFIVFFGFRIISPIIIGLYGLIAGPTALF
jgi:Zn-dependent protease